MMVSKILQLSSQHNHCHLLQLPSRVYLQMDCKNNICAHGLTHCSYPHLYCGVGRRGFHYFKKFSVCGKQKNSSLNAKARCFYTMTNRDFVLFVFVTSARICLLLRREHLFFFEPLAAMHTL